MVVVRGPRGATLGASRCLPLPVRGLRRPCDHVFPLSCRFPFCRPRVFVVRTPALIAVVVVVAGAAVPTLRRPAVLPEL